MVVVGAAVTFFVRGGRGGCGEERKFRSLQPVLFRFKAKSDEHVGNVALEGRSIKLGNIFVFEPVDPDVGQDDVSRQLLGNSSEVFKSLERDCRPATGSLGSACLRSGLGPC